MSIKEELCNAPIHPNKGAAGVRLNISSRILKKHWGEPLTIENISSDRERWEYPCVEFWIKTGKLTQVGVKRSYKGKTKEGIGIGSNRKEVEKVYGMLYWDGAWYNEDPPFGIGFDFDSYMIGEIVVTEIYIYIE